MDFVAVGVVEIFSPTDCARRNGGDVQRARSAGNFMRLTELRFAGRESQDLTRHGGDKGTRRRHGKRVESVAKKAGGKPVGYRELTLPRRTKFADGLPVQIRGILHLCAQQGVFAGGIEPVAVPCERSQAWQADGGSGGAEQCHLGLRHLN